VGPPEQSKAVHLASARAKVYSRMTSRIHVWLWEAIAISALLLILLAEAE
jgi:hypothetical protein